MAQVAGPLRGTRSTEIDVTASPLRELADRGRAADVRARERCAEQGAFRRVRRRCSLSMSMRRRAGSAQRTRRFRVRVPSAASREGARSRRAESNVNVGRRAGRDDRVGLLPTLAPRLEISAGGRDRET